MVHGPQPSQHHARLTTPKQPQKQLAAERIAALLEDRRIREAEEEAHRGQLNSQLEGLAERLRKAEEGLRQTTKDYILGGWCVGVC